MTQKINSYPGLKDPAVSLPPPWGALYIFIVYRLIITLILSLVCFYQVEGLIFRNYSEAELLYVASAYFLFAISCMVMPFKRETAYRKTVHWQVFFDIIFIFLMMLFSGGSTAALSILLAVSVAAANLLVAKNRSLFFAAIAAIAVIAQQSILIFYGQAEYITLSHSGLAGASYFATAAICLILAKRLQASEEIAARRKTVLTNLTRLNENIVQNMDSGVIVVDQRDLTVQLINHAAWKLLGMPELNEQSSLSLLCLPLQQQLSQWQSNHRFIPQPFKISNHEKQIRARFTDFGIDNQMILILLEDYSQLTQRAQQLKLSSLGRLTASIAHEIRNPLSAINHSAELLTESEMPEADRHLLEIILRHCNRVNEIIENVMQMSRRKTAQPQRINLAEWLQRFIADFQMGKGPEHQIKVHIEPADTHILFDPSHLAQIVTNLCENGLFYSKENSGNSIVYLTGGMNQEHVSAFLDVIDIGKGISEADRAHIFEPFYTSRHEGTGLGLFLSRELCEANQSQLQYIPMTGSGSCFRITFPHTD